MALGTLYVNDIGRSDAAAILPPLAQAQSVSAAAFIAATTTLTECTGCFVVGVVRGGVGRALAPFALMPIP